MALKTEVYISDVTNLTEARYYAGMEVDNIGFNATPNSPTHISTIQFDAINSWLSGIKTTWQWHLPISNEFITMIKETPSDYIELLEVPNLTTLLKLDKPVIIRIQNSEELKKITPENQKYIHSIIWEDALSKLPQTIETRLFITASTPSETETLLNSNKTIGISLKGVQESRPGWNEFDLLADILESLEI